MSEILKILKTIALTSIIITALYGVGSVINAVIPWTYLRDLFSIIKSMLGMLDWFWHTESLLFFLTAWLGVFGAVWGWRGVKTAIDWFKSH